MNSQIPIWNGEAKRKISYQIICRLTSKSIVANEKIENIHSIWKNSRHRHTLDNFFFGFVVEINTFYFFVFFVWLCVWKRLYFLCNQFSRILQLLNGRFVCHVGSAFYKNKIKKSSTSNEETAKQKSCVLCVFIEMHTHCVAFASCKYTHWYQNVKMCINIWGKEKQRIRQSGNQAATQTNNLTAFKQTNSMIRFQKPHIFASAPPRSLLPIASSFIYTLKMFLCYASNWKYCAVAAVFIFAAVCMLVRVTLHRNECILLYVGVLFHIWLLNAIWFVCVRLQCVWCCAECVRECTCVCVCVQLNAIL